MAGELTVDALCRAFCEFAQYVYDHPDEPVDQTRGLILQGVPGDDLMKSLMEAFGGTIKITVLEMPEAMKGVFVPNIAEGQGAMVFGPEDIG